MVLVLREKTGVLIQGITAIGEIVMSVNQFEGELWDTQ